MGAWVLINDRWYDLGLPRQWHRALARWREFWPAITIEIVAGVTVFVLFEMHSRSLAAPRRCRPYRSRPSKSSISARVGIDAAVPGRVTDIPAAAQPKRTA